MYDSQVVWLTTLLAVTTAMFPIIVSTYITESSSEAFAIREKEWKEGRAAGFTDCGFCGCPPGKDPSCCGDGCVVRKRLQEAEECLEPASGIRMD